MAITAIPNTNDYLDTLKRFKGYYCDSKIHIKKEHKTHKEGYGYEKTKVWMKRRLAKDS